MTQANWTAFLAFSVLLLLLFLPLFVENLMGMTLALLVSMIAKLRGIDRGTSSPSDAGTP